MCFRNSKQGLTSRVRASNQCEISRPATSIIGLRSTSPRNELPMEYLYLTNLIPLRRTTMFFDELGEIVDMTKIGNPYVRCCIVWRDFVGGKEIWPRISGSFLHSMLFLDNVGRDKIKLLFCSISIFTRTSFLSSSNVIGCQTASIYHSHRRTIVSGKARLLRS